MLDVKKEGILLNKTDLVFENQGVLNPAAIYEDNSIHIFYRAVRHENFSSIGYCRLSAPMEIAERYSTPVIFPQYDYEKQGVEDPRIVKIYDTYYLTYTAYDGMSACGALATSKDLKHFEKQGVIVPQVTFEEFKHLAESRGDLNEKYFVILGMGHSNNKVKKKIFLWDKNVIFFPRKINGKLCFLHRIRPGIQIVFIDELKQLDRKFWDEYLLKLGDHIVMDPKYAHDASYLGGGCPPIETENGWLLIYHGVHDEPGGYVYSACAALLDLENPQKELSRLPYPLFTPEHEWEQKGTVNNVCFPTGAVLLGDRLFIYYGAADEHIACASLNFSELINELLKYKIKE